MGALVWPAICATSAIASLPSPGCTSAPEGAEVDTAFPVAGLATYRDGKPMR